MSWHRIFELFDVTTQLFRNRLPAQFTCVGTKANYSHAHLRARHSYSKPSLTCLRMYSTGHYLVRGPSEFRKTAMLPYVFDLTFDSARTLRACHIVWRTPNEIGVEVFNSAEDLKLGSGLCAFTTVRQSNRITWLADKFNRIRHGRKRLGQATPSAVLVRWPHDESKTRASHQAPTKCRGSQVPRKALSRGTEN